MRRVDLRGRHQQVTRYSSLVPYSGVERVGRLRRPERTACKRSVSVPPKQYGTGGVRSQLNRLRAGLHPVTRCRLPQTTWADGSAVRAVHGYARKAGGAEEVDDKFRPYKVEDFGGVEAVASTGKSAKR